MVTWQSPSTLAFVLEDRFSIVCIYISQAAFVILARQNMAKVWYFLIVICNATNLARVMCSLHSESLFHSISRDNENRLMRSDAGISYPNPAYPLLIVFETLVRKHLGNTTSRNVEAGPRSHTERKCNRMLVGCS